MSAEEKVREEEEQDSDEFINKAAASGISPKNPERAFSNFCKLDLFRIKNQFIIILLLCKLTAHIEQSRTSNTIVKCSIQNNN